MCFRGTKIEIKKWFKRQKSQMIVVKYTWQYFWHFFKWISSVASVFSGKISSANFPKRLAGPIIRVATGDEINKSEFFSENLAVLQVDVCKVTVSLMNTSAGIGCCSYKCTRNPLTVSFSQFQLGLLACPLMVLLVVVVMLLSLSSSHW